MVYSGNLNDLRSAIGNLLAAGFRVKDYMERDHARMRYVVNLEVRTESGGLVADTELAHQDCDVLVNAATAWLRSLAAELRDWK